MIVICEECGKKYRLDSSKIKGKAAKFKCKVCSHFITVSPLSPEPPDEPPPFIEPDGEYIEERERRTFNFKIGGLKLRGKMVILFFCLPIALLLFIGFFNIYHLLSLTSDFQRESLSEVKKLAEKEITKRAQTVAEQVRYYIEKNPYLTREDLMNDKEFRRIAIQKSGKDDYTAFYATPDKDGIWRTWAHTNSKIQGIDMSTLKKKLGENFPGFWKIYTAAKNGKESKGYYTWQDADGKFRKKFMVCSPVKNTPYNVAATTYLDEFTKPMEDLKKRTDKQARDLIILIAVILALSVIIGGFTVFWYSNKLSGQIRHLTDVAERISVGEMEAEIIKETDDEIGDLGEAISRMQDSIRLSIERLRRRR